MSQPTKEKHCWKLELDVAEECILQEELHHHPNPSVRERCAALLKIAQGQSPRWVVLHGLLLPRTPDTVYRWLTWYQQDGITGLCTHMHGGARRGYL